MTGKVLEIVLALYKPTVIYYMECFKSSELSNFDKEIKVFLKRNQAKPLIYIYLYALTKMQVPKRIQVLKKQTQTALKQL